MKTKSCCVFVSMWSQSGHNDRNININQGSCLSTTTWAARSDWTVGVLLPTLSALNSDCHRQTDTSPIHAPAARLDCLALVGEDGGSIRTSSAAFPPSPGTTSLPSPGHRPAAFLSTLLFQIQQRKWLVQHCAQASARSVLACRWRPCSHLGPFLTVPLSTFFQKALCAATGLPFGNSHFVLLRGMSASASCFQHIPAFLNSFLL